MSNSPLTPRQSGEGAVHSRKRIEFVTATELSQILKVSERHIFNLRERLLPARLQIGRCVRYDLEIALKILRGIVG